MQWCWTSASTIMNQYLPSANKTCVKATIGKTHDLRALCWSSDVASLGAEEASPSGWGCSWFFLWCFLAQKFGSSSVETVIKKTKRGVEHKRHEYKLFLFCFQIIDSPHLFQTRCSKVGSRWSWLPSVLADLRRGWTWGLDC